MCQEKKKRTTQNPIFEFVMWHISAITSLNCILLYFYDCIRLYFFAYARCVQNARAFHIPNSVILDFGLGSIFECCIFFLWFMVFRLDSCIVCFCSVFFYVAVCHIIHLEVIFKYFDIFDGKNKYEFYLLFSTFYPIQKKKKIKSFIQ